VFGGGRSSEPFAVHELFEPVGGLSKVFKIRWETTGYGSLDEADDEIGPRDARGRSGHARGSAKFYGQTLDCESSFGFTTPGIWALSHTDCAQYRLAVSKISEIPSVKAVVYASVQTRKCISCGASFSIIPRVQQPDEAFHVRGIPNPLETLIKIQVFE